MSNTSKSANILRISALSQRKANPFALEFTPDQIKQIANDLDLSHLRKLSFSGTIAASGKTDWKLSAKLGATVGQPCVITLETVTTRIDTPVTRQFLAQMPDIETDAELGEEVEMPDDETIEPLGTVIDLEMILREALALALPAYPRSANADLKNAQFTEPGKVPMRDSDALPFAALAGLRDSLKEPANNGEIENPGGTLEETPKDAE
ncbi:MAG: DUF177 domain-containing protein [Rhodobacterales bacterium]|nr:DUF177 domain-containing protein [Rhodobacterales bacterium]